MHVSSSVRAVVVVVACLAPACRGAATSAPPAPLDRSCGEDAECVPAPGCCPTPCTASVINRRDEARARAQLSCGAAAPCPQAGACRTHAYLCVDGACALAFEGDPAYRPRR